jgi:predicted ATPase/DNA-binding NarL/FixJ family response regulator
MGDFLPFIGRDNEMSFLTAAFEDARQGKTIIAVAGGESGVGKTRLVTEFASVAAGYDAIVLSGAAIDLADAPPFWPVTDAMRKLLRDPAHDWVGRLLASWGEQLDRILMRPGSGAWNERDSAGLPAIEVLFQVVAGLADRAPVVLVVEDLQWADRSTRDLIVYLLANVVDEPILVLATYRSDALAVGHPLRSLLPEFRRDRRVRFLEVMPLDHAAVADIAADAFGSPADRELIELIWTRSEGNAFAVEETIRAVKSGDNAVPLTLRQLVLSRLEALPAEVGQIARAVAVSGVPVSHQLLAALVDLAETELIDGLRAAIEASVLAVDATGQGYALRHSLMTDVIVDDLLPGERIRLHRRIAAALSRCSGVSEVVDGHIVARQAHHWEQAGNYAQAFTAAVEAAVEAEQVFGFAEAHRLWRRALNLHGRLGSVVAKPDRAVLLTRAAEAAHLHGEHDEAAQYLTELLAQGPRQETLDEALVLQRLGRYLLAGGRSRRAVEAYERAAAVLPGDAAAADWAAQMAGHADALLLAGEYVRSRAEAERALDLARGAGANDVRARLLATLGFSLAYLESPAAGLDAMTQGLRLAEESGQPGDIGQAFVQVAELLSGPLNELAEGVEWCRRGADRMNALGLGRTYGVTLLTLAANALFRLGKWEDAAQAVDDALSLRPTGTQSIELRLARCRLLLGRGELDEAERDLDAIDLLSAETAGSRYRVPLLTLQAGLEMWRGRPDLARQTVCAGLRTAAAGSDDVWVIAPLVWHGMRAEAELAERHCTRVTTTPELRQLRDSMRHLTEQAANAAPPVQDVVTGFLTLCAAEDSRLAGAPDPDAWRASVAIWERHRQPYQAAYAQFRLADALLSYRSRAAGAAAALARAHAAACSLGARPLLDQIEDLAARARITLQDHEATPRTGAQAPDPASGRHPTNLASATPDSDSLPSPLQELTARELDVLTELAAGLTNRQIAGRLFISEKTVSVHISHILAKLGVRTRVQAIAAVHRLRTTVG